MYTMEHYSLSKKEKKCCHLKQHGQTWRTFMLSEIPLVLLKCGILKKKKKNEVTETE